MEANFVFNNMEEGISTINTNAIMFLKDKGDFFINLIQRPDKSPRRTDDSVNPGNGGKGEKRKTPNTSLIPPTIAPARGPRKIPAMIIGM